jgi:hypothetical protein
MLSVTSKPCMLSAVMLNVIMPSVVRLNVIMPSVVRPDVVSPFNVAAVYIKI